ncbi:MAG: KpsF/GutQ family sugar-phosphate isomerase [Leptospiraceae bacterium]|nr:KpsF/GutQ family sugar-phosphate isomerase [Leptospiraceae bacterium]MCP5512623.1 KpsF/GutQ family sugar-phosphate isomerase [Leptospiraceae bacterium]
MNSILEKIQKAIASEVDSLIHFQNNLDPNFETAVRMILESKGKVICTGVGKSGDIAKKISSTLTSTGTRAFFLHPTDAAHGDAGLIFEEDVVLAIGKSGESDELLALLPTIKKIGAKLIALTANKQSKLALASEIVIETPILKEACPLDLAPTSSTTIALVAGDAIAMALMELKNFKEDNFALYHPAGRLGKRLSLDIEDVMRKENDCPKVYEETLLPEILNEITAKHIGATTVVDKEGILKGIITDFDLRKMLTRGSLEKTFTAKEIMNSNPIQFHPGRKAYDVLQEMEDRKRPISVVPITDEKGYVMGMVSLHDLLQKGLK